MALAPCTNTLTPMKRTFRLAAIGFLCLGAGRSHVMPVGGQGGHPGNREITGRWLIALNEADGVQLSVRMTFAVSGPPDSPQWQAWSRQGAAREMVGGGTAALGRLLGKMPPREALIYIGNGTSEHRADTLELSGELESPFLGRRAFRGTLVAGRLHAELTRLPSGVKAGTMSGVRDSNDDALRDYVSLAADLERAIGATIFDPSIVRLGEYQRFVEELRRRFSRARDDLDVIAAFQALKPSLGISHFELIRNPRLAALPRDSVIAGDATVNRDRYVVLGFPAPDVAHLRITRWDHVESAVHRAFERMDSVGTRFLILDIRGNPGGDASSMAPLTHLIRDTVTVGVFLGSRWYSSNRSPPTASQFSTLAALVSDTTSAQLFDDIRAHGAVVGRAAPRAPYFAGAVYLLVDRRTASASEPLAHVLRTTRRATVIGERTAGAMLTALPQPLRDGWVAVIPEADFITGDGVRLEGSGVEPHVRSSPTEVFLAVAERITGVAPFSGTILRAGALEGLQRPAEAERVYRDALRMADRQSPAPSAARRAVLHKRLAIILMGRGDSARARHEYEEVLRLTPNDAEARAAVRRGT